MTDSRYTQVRIKATGLEGTRAFRGEAPHKYFATSVGRNTSMVPVYFEDTGELRFFNQDFLEDVDATD